LVKTQNQKGLGSSEVVEGELETQHQKPGEQVPPLSPQLKLWLFNAGNADCIVLKTPGNNWGVIDCGLRSSAPPPKKQRVADPAAMNQNQIRNSRETVQTVRDFLVRSGVKQLAFAILTHPERDHAQGLRELLQGFGPQVFCGVGASLTATRVRSLNQYIAEQVRQGTTRIVEPDYGAVIWEETQHSFKLIALGPSLKDLVRFARDAQSKLDLPQTDFTQLPPQPTPQEIARFLDLKSLIEQFDANFTWQRGSLPYNRISVATLTVWETKRVLLGADLPDKAWQSLATQAPFNNQLARKEEVQTLGKEETKESAKVPDYRAQVYKVSHHGSGDGLPPDLMPVFLAKNGTALVSSGGSSPSSPALGILRGLLRLDQQIYCTGRSHWCEAHPAGAICCATISLTLNEQSERGAANVTAETSIESEANYRESVPGICKPQTKLSVDS
jgi:beta-lactamase superfamily II metal-dependent hydrolase